MQGTAELQETVPFLIEKNLNFNPNVQLCYSLTCSNVNLTVPTGTARSLSSSHFWLSHTRSGSKCEVGIEGIFDIVDWCLKIIWGNWFFIQLLLSGGREEGREGRRERENGEREGRERKGERVVGRGKRGGEGWGGKGERGGKGREGWTIGEKEEGREGGRKKGGKEGGRDGGREGWKGGKENDDIAISCLYEHHHLLQLYISLILKLRELVHTPLLPQGDSSDVGTEDHSHHQQDDQDDSYHHNGDDNDDQIHL